MSKEAENAVDEALDYLYDHTGDCQETREAASLVREEIDRLREWKNEATDLLDGFYSWARPLASEHGNLGDSITDTVRARIAHLESIVERLPKIEVEAIRLKIECETLLADISVPLASQERFVLSLATSLAEQARAAAESARAQESKR